jgi:hypothetical protein
MQVSQILSEIDREIERLQQARNLLAGGATGSRRGTSSSSKAAGKRIGRRKMSAEARRRISEAQKARWAERRKRAAAKSSR